MPPPITAMRRGTLVIRANTRVTPSGRRRSSWGRYPSDTLCVTPEPFGRDRRALCHRAQFLERNVGVELAVAGESPEAAIAAGDHALAADDVGKAADALRDELGMLDVVGRGVEHARYQDLVVGQLDMLPHRPFMRVPRIGRFDN